MIEKNKSRFIRKNGGITLIALIVTIVVILILTGITVNVAVGDNGLITQARKTREDVEADEEEGRKKINELKGSVGNVSNDGKIDSVDSTNPTVNMISVSNITRKSFTVNVNVTETESGINKIEYSIDGGRTYITPNNATDKSYTFTNITQEKYSVYVKVIDKNGNVSIANTTVGTDFSTNYGRVDVIWIDKNNNVITGPLSPVLGGLTPIKWNGTTEATTTESDSDWYRYSSISGLGDNTTSRWANAKNSDGSYFVWVPRYAYRITYYKDDKSTTPTGYCDGYGIRGVIGDAKYSLDDGIKTISYNGEEYIVHPAFETNLSAGGWNTELSGIWVAKYEMSMEQNGTPVETKEYYSGDIPISSTIKAVSKPGVSSWRYCTIGVSYTNSLNYDPAKDSHMMKNSEWGAVAYLTHSQYGRNGHEVDVNNSSTYITGNGGGSASASSRAGITYAYNTPNGQKASSTGNITGIYDLNGGAWERTADFNSYTGSDDCLNTGTSFASKNGVSTKYATTYYNNTGDRVGTTLYKVGKIGDATKEVLGTTTSTAWFGDLPEFLNDTINFWTRGGRQYSTASEIKTSGIFASVCADTQGKNPFDTYRVVLASEGVKNVEEGIYRIVLAKDSSYSIDIDDLKQNNDGGNAQLWKTYDQKFELVYTGDGYYNIKCTPTNFLVDVYNNETTNGTNVMQWTANGGNNQKWRFIETANGKYIIQSRLGPVMTLYNGNVANGTNICLWQIDTASGNQSWVLTK